MTRIWSIWLKVLKRRSLTILNSFCCFRSCEAEPTASQLFVQMHIYHWIALDLIQWSVAKQVVLSRQWMSVDRMLGSSLTAFISFKDSYEINPCCSHHLKVALQRTNWSSDSANPRRFPRTGRSRIPRRTQTRACPGVECMSLGRPAPWFGPLQMYAPCALSAKLLGKPEMN